MGKKKLRSKYVSKGQRKSVSQKIKNDVKRNTQKPLGDIVRSMRKVEEVLSRTRDASTSDQRKKIMNNEMIELSASRLYEKFGPKGATWAACVQAVKTDYVSSFTDKWSRV